MATSAASRPRAINTRPIRGVLRCLDAAHGGPPRGSRVETEVARFFRPPHPDGTMERHPADRTMLGLFRIEHTPMIHAPESLKRLLVGLILGLTAGTGSAGGNRPHPGRNGPSPSLDRRQEVAPPDAVAQREAALIVLANHDAVPEEHSWRRPAVDDRQRHRFVSGRPAVLVRLRRGSFGAAAETVAGETGDSPAGRPADATHADLRRPEDRALGPLGGDRVPRLSDRGVDARLQERRDGRHAAAGGYPGRRHPISRGKEGEFTLHHNTGSPCTPNDYEPHAQAARAEGDAADRDLRRPFDQ